MNTLKHIVGANIKAQRKRVGLSQDELGERVDLSVTAIGMIERGASWPQYENLAAIARALGCDERVLISTEPVEIKVDGFPRELLQRLSTANEDELRDIAMLFRVSDEVAREEIEAELPDRKNKHR